MLDVYSPVLTYGMETMTTTRNKKGKTKSSTTNNGEKSGWNQPKKQNKNTEMKKRRK